MCRWIATFLIFYLSNAFLPEYVTEHWKEDDFYGSQFLNGINPNTIKCCSELPPNFPVTEEMVQPFLDEDTCLHTEMEVWKTNGFEWAMIFALAKKTVRFKVLESYCIYLLQLFFVPFFPHRMEIYLSVTRRSWMEYLLETMMVNLLM